VTQRELLGLVLLSIHNVHHLIELTVGARDAIERGAFAAYKARVLDRSTGAEPI
jgi:queuine/archaeosine tRNA-ribosyltransferase